MSIDKDNEHEIAYLDSASLARTPAAGGVFSCTVSRFDLGPLGPLEGAFPGARNCSLSAAAESPLPASVFVGTVGGVEACTVMGGAAMGFLLLWNEFLLEAGAVGGGDLTRGERLPVVGVPSAEAGFRDVLGSLETASATGPSCS